MAGFLFFLGGWFHRQRNLFIGIGPSTTRSLSMLKWSGLNKKEKRSNSYALEMSPIPIHCFYLFAKWVHIKLFSLVQHTFTPNTNMDHVCGRVVCKCQCDGRTGFSLSLFQTHTHTHSSHQSSKLPSSPAWFINALGLFFFLFLSYAIARTLLNMKPLNEFISFGLCELNEMAVGNGTWLNELECGGGQYSTSGLFAANAFFEKKKKTQHNTETDASLKENRRC